MVFLPPPSLSPKPSIGNAISGVVGIAHASGVSTIEGGEEINELQSMLSSFPLSCLHIKQAAELLSSYVDRKSLTSGATYLSPQYIDKWEK